MRDTSLVRTAVAPLALGVIVVLLWQWAVTALDIAAFILPGPFAIGDQFTNNLDNVFAGMLVTGRNAFVGLVVGAVVGILMAIVAALIRLVDGLAAPIVSSLAVVPIVALAPVLYTMYGAGAETARQIVAALAVFVPV